MKTRNYISVLTGLLLSGISFAQDIHFSNMEYAPMNLNPALAGANSPIQAIANYRSQWNSVAVPYNTMGISVDGRFNENQTSKTGIIAGGICFYNDQAGTNKVTTNSGAINLAYHVILDRTSTLGLGLYGGFGQRSLGISDAKWASQYDGIAYNSSLASGETFDNSSFTYLDAGAGLVYTYKKNAGYMTQNNQRAVNAGVAFYHVNTPTYSFINSSNEEDLYMRWNIFVNAEIGLSNSNTALLPGVYFNRQGKYMEILYGTYYRVTVSQASQITGFNKAFYIHLGLFNRWGDALIAKTMLEWHTMSVGFAYDINISNLNRFSNAKGGFELFLRYNLQASGPGTRSKLR